MCHTATAQYQYIIMSIITMSTNRIHARTNGYFESVVLVIFCSVCVHPFVDSFSSIIPSRLVSPMHTTGKLCQPVAPAAAPAAAAVTITITQIRKHELGKAYRPR